MKSLFDNIGLYTRFEDELKKWLGTPHKHLQCEIKKGADCGVFILKTLFNIGLVTDYNIVKTHSRLWYYLTDSEIILDIIDTVIERYMVTGYVLHEVDDLKHGDILTFSTGEVNLKTNHIAVLLTDDKMIHSIKKEGVHISDYNKYGQYLTHSYRVFLI